MVYTNTKINQNNSQKHDSEEENDLLKFYKGLRRRNRDVRGII